MANQKSNSKSGGIGILGLLLVAFIVMKLAGIGAVVMWSWWWVMSPLWLPIVLVIAIYLIIAFLKAYFQF